MSKTCAICGKGSLVGGKRRLLRAHYNPVKTERKKPNLQWARDAKGKRIKICTRCLKKGKQLAGA